jgi:hypothetical protein
LPGHASSIRAISDLYARLRYEAGSRPEDLQTLERAVRELRID